MKIENPQAVLFDMDGVIVPTTINVLAWIETFALLFNIYIRPEDWYRHEGRGPEFIAEALIKQYHLSGLTAKEVKNFKAKIAHDLIKRVSIKPYQEIESILMFLKKKNKKLGIVTGSTRKRLEESIPQLFPLFDVTVTVDDLVEGRKLKEKPDPEPYIYAAGLLGLPPKQVWVIENAVLGVLSGKSGQFPTLALATTVSSKSLKKAGADEVFPNHDKLFQYMEKTIT